MVLGRDSRPQLSDHLLSGLSRLHPMNMTTAKSQLFRLADVENDDQLCRALGIPLKLFRNALRTKDPLELYFCHRIPKRNSKRSGESRIVWECLDEDLARALKSIARRLDVFARERNNNYPHKCTYGYVRGGSTRSNAQQHCGAPLLLRADIENFFPSISSARVAKAFRALGISTVPARRLAHLLTIDGSLPLGLPTSPFVSNLVFLELDQVFEQLAIERKIRYTRYADDLTFSGLGNLPSKGELQELLKDHGFALSQKKFKLSKRGQAHFVTGLSVSEKDYPHAPRAMKTRLRQELYYCEKFGIAAHSSLKDERLRHTVNRLAGTVDYVCFMERRQTERIRAQWNRVIKSFPEGVLFDSVRQLQRDLEIVVDETEFQADGRNFLALCFVRMTSSIAGFSKMIRALQMDYIANPGAKGNLEALRKSGVHFTDAHYDLRNQTFNLIVDIPWSASIIFCELPATDRYQECWTKLFHAAIKQEFITADGASLSLHVEENDKVKLHVLKSLMTTEFERLCSTGSRRPLAEPMLMRIAKRENQVLALPDFTLAAFRSYAMQVADERILDFERVRDKVRYILDLDVDEFYDRKNPFVELHQRANGD